MGHGKHAHDDENDIAQSEDASPAAAPLKHRMPAAYRRKMSLTDTIKWHEAHPDPVPQRQLCAEEQMAEAEARERRIVRQVDVVDALMMIFDASTLSTGVLGHQT